VLLHALFMIARVLPVTSTTAATTINKGVLIATSLLRVPQTPTIAQINRASHEHTVNGPHVPKYRSVCSCEQWNWSYARWDLAHTCSYTLR
jgi:hypothetical protein